jgi:hypothetical protein
MREIDGAGHWLGERVRIGGSPQETLEVRVAFGAARVGVLYQDLAGGLPFNNHFQIVDRDGKVVFGPINLDPTGLFGTSSLAIAYDGSAFVMAWRESAGSGSGEVRWMRVDEKTFAVTGPVIVAKSGSDNPHGTFLLNAPVTIDVVGQVSMIGFIRNYWNGSAGTGVPKAQFARVDESGNVTAAQIGGSGSDENWCEEGWAYHVGNKFVPLWTSVDLGDSSANPPTRLHGNVISSAENVGSGKLFLSAPEARSEAALIEHPDHFATLAWLDQRSKATDILHGKIQLYAARLSSSLALADVRIFDHARFVQGTSHLNGTVMGTNVALMWLDERHSSGLTDPKPELWFDTVWY